MVTLQENGLQISQRKKSLKMQVLRTKNQRTLKKEDLFNVSYHMFAPNDTQHFLHLLKKSCGKHEVKTELYSLNVKFMERFNSLKKECKKSGEKGAIPLPSFKPGGFLNLWMELTTEKTRESFKTDSMI